MRPLLGEFYALTCVCLCVCLCVCVCVRVCESVFVVGLVFRAASMCARPGGFERRVTTCSPSSSVTRP